MRGFTLSELLIALGILGVIATFTIPKVLQTQTNGQYKAMAKEAAGAVSEAYQTLKLNNRVNPAISSADLSPYLNYVRRDTTSVIDSHPSAGTVNCANSWEVCLVMHNGGMLRLTTAAFDGTATTAAIEFDFDPDAKTTGNTSGEATEFYLYYNGLITSRSNTKPNTYSGGIGPYGPDPALDPPWFNWN